MITDVKDLTLIELAKRGLDAHLREAVIQAVMQEVLAEFHATLRQRLEHHCRHITIGHIKHVQDVLGLRDEIQIELGIGFNEEGFNDV